MPLVARLNPPENVRVAALALLALGGSDRQAHFPANRAADETAHALRLPTRSFSSVPSSWPRSGA